LLFLILLLSFGQLAAQSQTAGDIVTLHVSDYCLIDTNHAPVNLVLSSSVAGAPVTSVFNSDMFVKISSVVPGNTHRTITARIASGAVPAGTRLSLIAATCTFTNSGGALGTVVAVPVVLNAADQTIVDMIRSCYTGTGNTDGYRLTYTWFPYSPAANYQLLQATTTPSVITVVLTITAKGG